MPTVTKTSYGQNLGNSIKGMLFGVVLFLLSFYLFWRWAGVPDLGKIAGKAVEVNAAETSSVEGEQFIALTGQVTTPQMLGDSSYIKPGKYITISRSTEIYAWVKRVESESKENVGGSTTTVKTTYYDKQWVSSPQQDLSAEDPADKRAAEAKWNERIVNPTGKRIQDASDRVSELYIGKWSVKQDMPLPGGESLALSDEVVLEGNDVQENFIYVNDGGGSLSSPKIGDIRISFSVLKNDFEGTAFAKAKGSTLTTYSETQALKDEATFYAIKKGDKEAGVKAYQIEARTKKLLWWFGGLLAMFIGLQLIVAPLSTVLKVLPFLQTLSKGLLGIVTFAVSLGLSLVVTLLFGVMRNPVMIAVVVVAIVGVIILVMMKKKKEPAAA